MTSQNNHKAYIIAGEASGDVIGALLMTALNKKMPHIQISCIGGRKMEELGYQSLFDISKISLMGYLEIIPHIFTLKRLISTTIHHILHENPDVVITIDSPGFNFRVVEGLKSKGFKGKFVHIVAPQVWAHHPEVAEKVAKLYDHLLTLLPFEPPFFTKYGLKTDFIGHPIFEQNFISSSGTVFRETHKIPEEARIICITPGSRKGEIKRHTKIIIEALEMLSTNFKIFPVFALNKKEDAALVESYLPENFPHISVIGEGRLSAYAAADFAIAKSGSNNLEIAAAGTPMLVFYRMNPLTYWYIKRKILVKNVCLINILLERQVVPELIQGDCSPEKIASIVYHYLSNDKLSELQVKETAEALRDIGYNSKSKPSEIAAEIIIKNFLK
ncbi:MAG: Lipid-A-disaccharide synthase [Pseudomonadota bacterium]|jgi:lipid-A-disaccharide synthase